VVRLLCKVHGCCLGRFDRRRDARIPGGDQIVERESVKQDPHLKQYLRPGYQGPCWSVADLQLLGMEPDEVIAARIGRTANAVRVMRTRRGIPSARDRRRRR
jgi:hypothetical protein